MHASRGKRPFVSLLDPAIALGLFVAAWALRAAAPALFVTWDEPAWVYRSVVFLTALERRDWAATLLVGHPGVLTMWSGALSLAWHRGATGLVTPAQLDAIAAMPWQIHDVALLRQLTALLPLAKAATPLIHAGLLAMLYGLLRRLVDRPVALAAALLLLSDPFNLALARVLHLDALASALMLAAILGLTIYGRQRRRRWLLFAGAMLGLALLTKTTTLLAAPAGGLALWAFAWQQRQRQIAWRRALCLSLGPALRAFALWLLAAALLFGALWPAMWAIPGQALRTVFGLSLQYAAQEAEATTSFFQGQAATRVGVAFYPVALWLRATPLAVAGVALAALAMIGRWRKMNCSLVLVLSGYALLYLALASLSLKKFDRYALPALLALDVLAALGWMWALEGAVSRVSRRSAVSAGLGLGLIVAQAFFLLRPLFPGYYLAYYNPLAGGIERAARTLPVGWGEGVEQAARYLADQPDAAERTVATWAVAALAPLYPGPILPLTAEALLQADAVLLTIGDLQSQEPLPRSFFERGAAAYTATVAGLPYAWVYENDYGRDTLDVLTARAQAGDWVVASSASTLQKRDRSAARWLTLNGQSEQEIAAQLQAALSTDAKARQVFFFALKGEEVRRAVAQRLLAERGLLMERRPFEYGALDIYRLPSGAAFSALEASQPIEAVFGEALTLTGYGLASPTVQYRQEVGVALRWQIRQPLPEDYHLSLALVDQDGHRWGQRDAPLRDADGRGTADWMLAQPVLTRETVPLDAGAPPGLYTLEARLYNLADMRSLAVKSPAAQGDALPLATVRVLKAEAPPAPDELPARERRDLTVADRAHILGLTLSEDEIYSGDELTLTLFWRVTRASTRPYQWELALERAGQVAMAWRQAPAGEGYASDLWSVDEVLRYPYRLAIPYDLSSGEYTLRIGAVDAADGSLLGGDAPLAMLRITHRERLWSAPPMDHTKLAYLGEEIAFLGYDLAAEHLRPGDNLSLTLYWQARRAPAADYTVFVHLLDAQGMVRAQWDSAPMVGERPTSGWLAGEVVRDRVMLAIDRETPAGGYLLQVGLYRAANGERLPVLLDPNGAATTDAERRIALQTLYVDP